MDSRQNHQQFSSSNASQSSANYGFNGAHSDPFNAFVNVEDGSSYDPPWGGQAFPAHPTNLDGFEQSGQTWQQNPYQNPNLLPMPSFSAQSRDFDHGYSRTPSSFNYQGFDGDPNQVFANSTFNSNLDYGQASVSERYGFPSQAHYGQTGETVSPQALQTYSNIPQASQSAHQTSTKSIDPLHLRGAGGQEAPPIHPLTQQEWINLTTPNSTSIYRAGLHIKPTDAFSNATKSSRLDGFIFVGKESIALTTHKSTVPSHKKRKCVNEVMQFLQREKGDGPWHADRATLLKKIKSHIAKHSGPKIAASSAASRGVSTTDLASSSDSSDSESGDGSEEYSESELEVEPEEISPLPPSRPTDPNKAIEYDLIRTVWAKRRSVLSGTVIRTALSECWNIFKNVRDKWKARSTHLQQAIEKKDNANKSTYERRIVEQRKLLESCIRLTLKHGHPSIVEKLGENPQLLVIFYQFLGDRFKDGEYTGSLIASMLELIARCNSVDKTLLEKTKIDKVLDKLLKKGDASGKTLAKKIFDNATHAGRKQRASSGEKSADAKAELNVTNRNGQGGAESVVASKATEENVRAPNETDKKAAKVSGKSKSSSTGPSSGETDQSKIKVVHTQAKPSAFFAGLQSASKKPGTSTKGKDGKPSTEHAPKNEEAKPASKPTFSFTATMANLVKQKEAPPVKQEDTRKVETPEEKTKRLRKEQRRGLRVSFKSDHELVQIREFVHDSDEDSGHNNSQTRDVGDSKGEGQMLKMHKDLDLMDEDEDYEPPEEIEAPSVWDIPSQIDFSAIDSDELGRNYTSRGGQLEPESQERKIQDQRDSSTLMVVYSNHTDIPTSPRDPPTVDLGERLQEQRFGDPSDLVKGREAEHRANRALPTASVAGPSKDIGEILRMLNSQHQVPQPSQMPVQQPQMSAQSAASSGLNALFAQLANANGNAGQQSTPSPVMQPHQQANAPAFNLQATLSHLAQPSQNQQPFYQQQPPFASQSTQPTQGTPDLAAILAQINYQRANQAPQAQPVSFNPPSQQNDNDRKRQLDAGDQDEYEGSKKVRGSTQPEKMKYTGVPILPCRFWQEGKCRKGDQCTYLHE